MVPKKFSSYDDALLPEIEPREISIVVRVQYRRPFVRFNFAPILCCDPIDLQFPFRAVCCCVKRSNWLIVVASLL
jgi:hypothetical protein